MKDILAGYMPIGRQHGFLFGVPAAKYVAHELGHGAFGLHHTFSSETESFSAPQYSTDNLMDYNGGTALNHKQWTWMHEKHGSGLFGFLADEEKSEMIATADKDSISLSITKLNDAFAPCVGELEIEYTLDERTQRIIAKYPNENFEVILVVADSLGNIVHTTKQKADNNASLTWNGFKDKEQKQSISYEDGPYKVSVSLVGGKKIDGILDVRSWKEFKDLLYQAISGDSLMYISTSVDTTFNILQGAALEWVKYPDMHKFLIGQTDEKRYDSYKNIRDIYMTYEGIQRFGNPFEWIKQNFTNITFLEKNLYVHKKFAEVLDNVQQSLIDAGSYNEVVAKYKNNIGAMSMRVMNDPNGTNKISEHGLGMAIDFLPRKNPQILGSNIYVVFYIKQMTGFDIGSKKTVDQIKNAHEKFVTKFENVPIDTLINDFDAINRYESDINNVSLYDLKQMISFIKDSTFMLSGIHNGKKNIVENLKKVQNIIPHYLRSMVNENSAVLQGECLFVDLNQILNMNFVNDSLNYDKYLEFETSIKSFKENFQINFPNETMSTFGLNLKKGISNIGFGNNLLYDGFCNIEKEIIDAFINSNDKIQWGGTFNKKIDPMHFGFTTSEATKIIKDE
ncbi:MAG: hypothetical protein MJ069_09005 [Salinivirgaceae bacterium]|nr:hypothetical protein [Salinivirgaceae bacterium]